MAYTVKVQLSSFDDPRLGRNDNQVAINALLRALVICDEVWLRQHPECPLLYESGVRYVEEPPLEEWFADIPTVLTRGFGDCDDLAAWRCAELRVRFHTPAEVYTLRQVSPEGATLYHVQVTSPLTGAEDPSSMLGMNWR